MPWYTTTDEFDTDFGVAEWHGTNAFIRDGDSVSRTYFINSCGDEAGESTWSYLDMTALERQEQWENSPEGYPKIGRTSGGTGTTNTVTPSWRRGQCRSVKAVTPTRHGAGGSPTLRS